MQVDGDHIGCCKRRSYDLKKIILAVAVAAVAIMGVAGSALAGGGTGITATPAATKRLGGSHGQVRPFGERNHQRDEPGQHLGWPSEPLDER